MVQPSFSGPSIGVCKHEDLKLRRHLLHGRAQVVDLFATILRLTRDNDLRFYTRGGGHAFHGAISGIGLRGEHEEDLVVLMIEFAERDEVAFEPWFHAAARANDGGARGVEARVSLQALLDIRQPLNALPEQKEAGSDL